MNEAASYGWQIRWVCEEQAKCLEGLSGSELNRAPDVPGANSPAAIAAHTVGVTRAFVLGFVCKQDVVRDRPAEFATSFHSVPAAQQALRQLGEDVYAALSGGMPDLDAKAVPSAEVWGSPMDRPVSKREACVEALRHAAIHLGEMRFTRSLREAGRV
jgi:hypothetical protein